MRFRCPTLLLAFCLAPAAFAQQAATVATQARDAAAVYVAQNNFLVSRLGTECLALIGRPESPQAVVDSWRQRNARYVSASSRYLDKRMEEAEAEGGKPKREAMLAEIRSVVQAGGEAFLRTLMQGRREDSCMRAVTLLDTGTLDISPQVPQFEQLEALARWAER